VGEIHNRQEVLALIQALHPPRYGGHGPHPRRQRRAESRRVRQDGEGSSGSSEHIGHVERPDQRRLDRDAQAVQAADGQPGGVRGEDHILGAEVRRRVKGVGQGAIHALRPLAEHVRAGVVGVDHGDLGDARLARRGRRHLEKACFGVAVLLPCAVKVQMLVGDVGQHSDVEGHSTHAPLGQPVRGRFQHSVRQAGGDHARQVPMHLVRARRGDVQPGVQRLVADQRAHRRDQPGADPRRPQNAVNERGGRGFSVRAGNADHSQLVRRVAVVGRSQRAERRPPVEYLGVGHGAGDHIRRALADHRCRATRHCLADQIVSIHRRPAPRQKDSARLDVRGVLGDRGRDGCVAVRAGDHVRPRGE